MFAIDHAATALVIKRRFPEAPLPLLLVSVQLMELLWVVLNLLGVERVTTEPTVRSVADVHLAYMPWSHSVATMLGAALLVWVGARAAGRPRLGLALALGVASHLLLDLVTHDHDLAWAPGLEGGLGLGLYGAAPMVGFAIELLYGVLCWRIFRGSRALLLVIVGFNLANISFFSAALPGPEELLANRPLAVVLVVLAQIVITLLLVRVLARDSRRKPSNLRTGATVTAPALASTRGNGGGAMNRAPASIGRRAPQGASFLAALLSTVVGTLSNLGCASVDGRTITVRNEVFIQRPAEEVFAYLADFENMPRWNYYVKSVVRTTPGETGLGATFHQVRKDDWQDYRIVEYELPRALTVTTLPPERSLAMRFSLLPASGGTTLVDEWTLDTGLPWPIAGLAVEPIRRAVATNLQKLRELLEVGETLLPDGRTSRR